MAIQGTRKIGLHCRIQTGLQDILDKVQQTEVPVVQSFLLDEMGYHINLKHKFVDPFCQAKESLGFDYIVHAAYWSNLTNVTSKEFGSICKEAKIARDLQASGIVVHIGASKQRLEKSEQVLFVAEALNELICKVDDITIMLENGPHAGRNFGGDIQDFALLMPMIEQKHRVSFCLDTAHAYVYGYDLIDQAARIDFLQQLDTCVSNQHISLIHLNDTAQLCGSQIDKHGMVGQDLLSSVALPSIMNYQPLRLTPLLLELPSSCTLEEEIAALNAVRAWNS